jgi:hypothetical protein
VLIDRHEISQSQKFTKDFMPPGALVAVLSGFLKSN